MLDRREFFVGAAALALPGASRENWGHFLGSVDARWNCDGRTMRLLAPYSFVDPRGLHWPVPAQANIDGASIPQAFWSIIGPYEERYRNASVIHDYYCDYHLRPWQAVHRMFYEGMRAHGVDQIKAKLMFAAVWYKGPRWEKLETLKHPDANASMARVSKVLSSVNNSPRNCLSRRTESDAVPQPHVDSMSVTRADLEQMRLLAGEIKEKDPPLEQIAVFVGAALLNAAVHARKSSVAAEVIEFRDRKGLNTVSPSQRELAVRSIRVKESIRRVRR